MYRSLIVVRRVTCRMNDPPGREVIVVGDGRRLRVECVGSVDGILHGHTDVCHTLFDVSYDPGLGFNLYSS